MKIVNWLAHFIANTQYLGIDKNHVQYINPESDVVSGATCVQISMVEGLALAPTKLFSFR